MTHDEEESQGPLEIALVGDLTEHAADLAEKLLGVPPGGSCTMYFDSPGGSPYCASGVDDHDGSAAGAGDGRRRRRMLLSRPLAVGRLPHADRDSVQRAVVSSDEMAERGARSSRGSGGVGPAFRAVGASDGHAAGPDVRLARRAARPVDPVRALHLPEPNSPKRASLNSWISWPWPSRPNCWIASLQPLFPGS